MRAMRLHLLFLRTLGKVKRSFQSIMTGVKKLCALAVGARGAVPSSATPRLAC